MKAAICPMCGEFVKSGASACPHCGCRYVGRRASRTPERSRHGFLGRTAWDWIRGFAVLAFLLVLHMPSTADSVMCFLERLAPVALDRPAARFEAPALAKACREGCSWEGKTVVADGRAASVSLNGWPMFIVLEGGLICRLDSDAAEEAAGAERRNPVSVIGVVKTEKRKVFLRGCRVYRDDGYG